MSLIQLSVRRFMDEASGNLDEAKRIGAESIQTDTVLRDMLALTALEAALENLWRSGRAQHWHEAMNPVVGRTSAAEVERVPFAAPPKQKGEVSQPNPRLAQSLAAKRRVLEGGLRFEMPGGTMIGDWTKADALVHGHQVVLQGQATMLTGRFIVEVAEMCSKPDTVIGDELRSADVDRVLRKYGGVKALRGAAKELASVV